MSSSLDNQKALAKKFIELDATWDGEKIVTIRTDDCTHQLLPESLGHPKRNNKEFKQFYAQFAPIWSNYRIDIIKEMHDGESHQSMIHIWNHSDSIIGPFEVETVWFLDFTEDGKKIKKVEEFVDTDYLTNFLGKLPQPESDK